jgi:hypothetical protein
MEVIDLSWTEHLKHRHNSPLLPKSIRGLIIGKSGCGKTTLLLNLLLRPGWLDYNNLKVFGKSLFQPEYRIIKSAFEQNLPKEVTVKLFSMRDEIQDEDPIAILQEAAKSYEPVAKLPGEHDNKDTITCQFFESAEDVPDPKDMNKDLKNLMIFDDLQLEKQGKCESYYVRGRHSNADCFYLAQNYFKLPTQTIRENANFICIFPQDNKNINHLYNDHASTYMPLDEFKYLCKRAWEIPHGFLVIDLSSHKFKGKYRCGLDLFYIPRA